MPEASVVAGCQRTLTRRGAWWVNVHGSGVGRNGIADILACYRGWFLAVECKAPKGGRLTKLQRYELDKVKLAAGVAIVVQHVEHLVAVLDAIDAEIDATTAALQTPGGIAAYLGSIGLTQGDGDGR